MASEAEVQGAPLRLLFADDHAMVLDIFSVYLTRTSNMVVRKAQTLDEALDAIREEGAFDLVLLDFNMPGMNGVTGLKRAIRANAQRPVAVITSNPSFQMIDQIMKAGSAGIILKTTPAASLANAIAFMASGESYLPRELMRSPTAAPRGQPGGALTQRETAVLVALSEGRPNKEIAALLNLAEPTVKMHVSAICRKLGAQNRTHAAVLARSLGLV